MMQPLCKCCFIFVVVCVIGCIQSLILRIGVAGLVSILTLSCLFPVLRGSGPTPPTNIAGKKHLQCTQTMISTDDNTGKAHYDSLLVSGEKGSPHYGKVMAIIMVDAIVLLTRDQSPQICSHFYKPQMYAKHLT